MIYFLWNVVFKLIITFINCCLDETVPWPPYMYSCYYSLLCYITNKVFDDVMVLTSPLLCPAVDPDDIDTLTRFYVR